MITVSLRRFNSPAEHIAPVSRPSSWTSFLSTRTPGRLTCQTITTFIPLLLSPLCPCWNTLHESWLIVLKISHLCPLLFPFILSSSASLIPSWLKHMTVPDSSLNALRVFVVSLIGLQLPHQEESEHFVMTKILSVFLPVLIFPLV